MRNYLAFTGLCLGFFIIMMDTTTVPLIYTALIGEFHVTPAMAAWVNNSYLITYAAFLLLGGRLGDAYNRAYVVYYALIGLAAGALIAGYSQTLTGVIAGRALMGIGAGMLTPQSMAFISILFTQGQRGMAFGIWGAVAGIATAAGPVVTELLLHLADWRWIMWINIPIALLALLVLFVFLPAAQGKGLKLRELGVNAAFGISLTAVIFGLQIIGAGGGRLYSGLILIVLGAVISVVLARREIYSGYDNILTRSLWQDKIFLRLCFISGCLGFGLTAFYLPLAYLLEVGMRLGPFAISCVMITIAVANALTGPWAGYFSDKWAPEKIVRYGLAVFALACVLTGLVGIFPDKGTGALVVVFMAMAIAGIGTGLSFAPLANMALRRAELNVVGRAAAFYNSTRQVMSALGSVVIALLFDAMVRKSSGFANFNTILTDHNSSHLIGTAVMVCFMVIALSLLIGSFLSGHRRQTLKM